MSLREESSRAFLIGSTGLIGASLAPALDMKFLVFKTSSKLSPHFLYFNLYEHEKFDFKIIKSGDLVYFASAISSPDKCSEDFSACFRFNVNLSISAIEKFLDRGARVIFLSSDAVYGEKDFDFFEGASPAPLGDYGIMKYAVERFFENEKNFKSVRLSYVLSPSDKFISYLRFSNRENIQVSAYKDFFRSVISISDVVDGLVSLGNKWTNIPDPIINFAGPETISRAELAKLFVAYHFQSLEVDVSPGPPEFFKKRARVIRMRSKILPKLLGRKPTKIEDVVKFLI